MTLVERLFRLREISPFDRLTDAELTLIAEAAIERQYEAGRCVASKEKPSRALFLTIEGSLTDASGRKLPRVWSPAALVNGTPLPSDVFADKERGAMCLLINKGHFFTILYECPELAVGFIEQAAGADSEKQGDSGT